jgi:hypothetical protein
MFAKLTKRVAVLALVGASCLFAAAKPAHADVIVTGEDGQQYVLTTYAYGTTPLAVEIVVDNAIAHGMRPTSNIEYRAYVPELNGPGFVQFLQ